jgi:uncharacterized protein YqjF (DUF2071 family)
MATKTKPTEITTTRRLRALVHTEDGRTYQVEGETLEALRRAAVELGELADVGQVWVEPAAA